MRTALHLLIATGCLIVAGCALPSESKLPENFISRFEVDLQDEVAKGLQAAKRGRYVDAEFSFRKALAANPQNEKILMNLATALGRQQEFSESENIYRSLLQRNPDNVAVKSALARLYADQLEYDAARKLYREILDQTEEEEAKYVDIRVSSLRSLAAIAFRLGDEELATCYSEEAAALGQASPVEKARHARLLLSRGQLGLLDAALASVAPEGAPDFLVHQLVLYLYEVERDEDARLICESLVVRPGLSPAVEADCLWIIALTKKFEVLNTQDLELEDEIRLKGFELALKEFGENTSTIFLPYRLTEDILAVQAQFLPEEVEEASVEDAEARTAVTLFALPKGLYEAEGEPGSLDEAGGEPRRLDEAEGEPKLSGSLVLNKAN
ncbi:MAG: hypothetical protein KDD70_09660 [Bdellovibrionales bacterium]|nr:hypothetical protein [Bdellovibrionales bacterium]